MVTVKAGEVVTIPDFPSPPEATDSVDKYFFLAVNLQPTPSSLLIFAMSPYWQTQKAKFALRSREHSSRRIPIQAWHPRQGFSKVVAFTPEDAKDFRIELQPEGSAVGAVKDENGNVVPNLKVNLEVFS